MRILVLADLATQPWKNGGGTTREIARAEIAPGPASGAWVLVLPEGAPGGPADWASEAAAERAAERAAGRPADFRADRGTGKAPDRRAGLDRVAPGQARRMVWRLSMADVTADGPFSAFPGLSRILTVTSGPGLVFDTRLGSTLVAPLCPVRFSGDLPVHARLADGTARGSCPAIHQQQDELGLRDVALEDLAHEDPAVEDPAPEELAPEELAVDPAAQVGTKQVGTAKIGTAKIGTAQIGTAQIGKTGADRAQDGRTVPATGAAVRDINLIFDPALALGSVRLVRLPPGSVPLQLDAPAQPGGLRAFLCLSGRVNVACGSTGADEGAALLPGQVALGRHLRLVLGPAREPVPEPCGMPPRNLQDAPDATGADPDGAAGPIGLLIMIDPVGGSA